MLTPFRSDNVFFTIKIARLLICENCWITLYQIHLSRIIVTDIGWASLQLFSFERLLAQGSFVLLLWPSTETEKKVGPAPDCGSNPSADTCPVISIDLPELMSQVCRVPKMVHTKYGFPRCTIFYLAIFA